MKASIEIHDVILRVADDYIELLRHVYAGYPAELARLRPQSPKHPHQLPVRLKNLHPTVARVPDYYEPQRVYS